MKQLELLKKVVQVFLSKHTIPQKFNYIKYIFSKKDVTLKYDPVSISIVATNRCTLSCAMCPTHSPDVPRGYEHIQDNKCDITYELFKDIIDRFSNARVVNIIGSGEPLLNKDLFRMIEYAAGKNMTVKTFSNGTILVEWIDQILSSRLEGITISLNGHSKEEYSRMTGMKSDIYDKIRSSIDALIKERNKRGSRLKIKISHIIDTINYKHIPDMIRISTELGADHTFLCNFLPCRFDGLTADERTLKNDSSVVSEIASYIKALPEGVASKVTFPKLLDRGDKKNHCDTHFYQMRFDGDGNVSSCSMMLLNMTGNGRYDDPNVWNNTFFCDMRKCFMGGREDIPAPCLDCPDNCGVYPW